MNSPDLNAASLSPLEAARALAPQIRACAEEIESTRELPRALFETIADAGMFHLAVPRDIGGAELDLPTFVQVIEEIAKADASTAWAINQGGTFATRSAFMAPDVAREIWIDTPRSVVSNTPGPTAKAVAVPGGYRVTGRQPFSTGIRHASWVAAHAQVFENGELRRINGQPEARYLLLPKAEATVHDTWNTRGMRGTGTHTFEVNDVFVPEERTVFPKGGTQLSGGVRYKIPFTLMFASGDGMAALGVARSCLTAFYELAGAKTPRYVQGLMREQPITQFTAGQAEAALRAGRALLMEAVNNLWHDLSATGEISLERRVELRLAGTHAIHLARSVVDSVYQICGATAIFEGHALQRHFQDIHVITQHVQGRLSHYELVGQHWLGLKIEEARL